MCKIDILLPTFNGEDFLEEQINSLLNQTYKNIKILIRDDGSTDQTKYILKCLAKLDERIIVSSGITENMGLVNNINYLLGLSDAEYIMYCDQDDVWLENKIEILLDEILKRENEFGKKTPVLVHSDCYVTDVNLKVKCLFQGNKPLSYGLHNSLFKFYVQGASSIINKSLKEELYPFINNVYIHDRYTHLVSEIIGKRFYVNLPLMYYRQHSSNLIGSSSLKLKIKNMFLFENFNFYLKKDRLLIETIFKEKYPCVNLLGEYLTMTTPGTSLLKKFNIKRKYKIKMRLKELFIMIVKL